MNSYEVLGHVLSPVMMVFSENDKRNVVAYHLLFTT